MVASCDATILTGTRKTSRSIPNAATTPIRYVVQSLSPVRILVQVVRRRLKLSKVSQPILFFVQSVLLFLFCVN